METIKKLAKLGFRTAGFEIRAFRNARKLYDFPETSGTIIELLGPSGIGKTTLRETLQRQFSQRWNFGFTGNPEGPASFLLDGLYQEMLFRKIKALQNNAVTQRNRKLEQTLRMLAFSIRNLKTDRAVMVSGAFFRGGVFFDDGVTHNFGNQLLEIIEQSIIPNEVISLFFVPRVFLNLTAPAETVIRRLKKRSLETPGAGNDVFGMVGSENPLESRVKQSLELRKRLCNHIENIGGSVFELDIDQGMDLVVEQAMEIESLVVASSRERAGDTAALLKHLQRGV